MTRSLLFSVRSAPAWGLLACLGSGCFGDPYDETVLHSLERSDAPTEADSPAPNSEGASGGLPDLLAGILAGERGESDAGSSPLAALVEGLLGADPPSGDSPLSALLEGLLSPPESDGNSDGSDEPDALSALLQGLLGPQREASSSALADWIEALTRGGSEAEEEPEEGEADDGEADDEPLDLGELLEELFPPVEPAPVDEGVSEFLEGLTELLGAILGPQESLEELRTPGTIEAVCAGAGAEAEERRAAGQFAPDCGFASGFCRLQLSVATVEARGLTPLVGVLAYSEDFQPLSSCPASPEQLDTCVASLLRVVQNQSHQNSTDGDPPDGLAFECGAPAPKLGLSDLAALEPCSDVVAQCPELLESPPD